jgi:nicotinate-nucleotide pyrophosphorylase (carboxylating)
MSCDELRRAVAMRDEASGPVALEASGGVTLETVAAVAETGVERIAIGAITHSATAVDIGLDDRDA